MSGVCTLRCEEDLIAEAGRLVTFVVLQISEDVTLVGIHIYMYNVVDVHTYMKVPSQWVRGGKVFPLYRGP